MLLTQKRLRQLLGILWLIDGLLQLQPQMFTMNMVNGVMVPTLQNQPGPVAASLQWIISVTTHNLILVNLLIAAVQIVIGVLLISGLWVRWTIIASIVWALIVWYGGEGMSMLLTGQAGILTGAPGAVLLYPLLGLLVYPQKKILNRVYYLAQPFATSLQASGSSLHCYNFNPPGGKMDRSLRR